MKGKIKREKKVYIIATLKIDENGYIFLFGPKNDTVSDLNYIITTFMVVHLIYKSRNLVSWQS